MKFYICCVVLALSQYTWCLASSPGNGGVESQPSLPAVGGARILPLFHYKISNKLIEDEEEHRMLSRHEREFEARRRRLQSSPIDSTADGTEQITPLFQGIGTHYADVWVGTPVAQRQTLIVDTGSHYTAFPCVGCKNCGESFHTNNYFDPTKSTSFKQLGCTECDPGGHCSNSRCEFSQVSKGRIEFRFVLLSPPLLPLPSAQLPTNPLAACHIPTPSRTHPVLHRGKQLACVPGQG